MRRLRCRLSSRTLPSPPVMPASALLLIESACCPLPMQEQDAALAKLESFSHIAFTSRNGVQAVLARLAAMHNHGGGGGGGGSLAAAAEALNIGDTSVWALGADAGALQDAGVRDVHTPEEV